MKLPVKWHGGAMYTGLRDGHDLWITNGHVAARAAHWEQPEGLGALLENSDCLFWEHPQQWNRSGRDLEVTLGRLLKAIQQPAGDEEGILLPVLLREPELASGLAAGVEFAARMALLDWGYAQPFGGMTWKMAVEDPAAALIVEHAGVRQALIMPLRKDARQRRLLERLRGIGGVTG